MNIILRQKRVEQFLVGIQNLAKKYDSGEENYLINFHFAKYDLPTS